MRFKGVQQPGWMIRRMAESQASSSAVPSAYEPADNEEPNTFNEAGGWTEQTILR